MDFCVDIERSGQPLVKLRFFLELDPPYCLIFIHVIILTLKS